ncbi:helix-turn-helix domain-containing protein [Pseudactinotalea sp.]|uniref:helix-turn-helix domain-containing protein n=1 Tax=Pseudactinotalea sp. TaxID=1926260 RepID=UPI003B3A2E64
MSESETVRATVVRAGGPVVSAARTGLGTWTETEDLPGSCRAALLAFRLADDVTPVVDTAALGVLFRAVEVLAPMAAEFPDVAALGALDARTAHTLRTLVHAESVRAAAAALGMHHSTLQERHDKLTRTLGYDPRSATGLARYELTRLLARLNPR